ncbi:MAG: hypothetical protein R3330_12870, partial [Saprospiraceae bacterium]|nr:hypothetical protein [Saprospiraceae bacterium]
TSSGVLTMAGEGGTNNENLIWDFETTADEVGVSSSTGVTLIDFGVLDLSATTITAADLTVTGDISAGGDIIHDDSPDSDWILQQVDQDQRILLQANDATVNYNAVVIDPNDPTNAERLVDFSANDSIRTPATIRSNASTVLYENDNSSGSYEWRVDPGFIGFNYRFIADAGAGEVSWIVQATASTDSILNWVTSTTRAGEHTDVGLTAGEFRAELGYGSGAGDSGDLFAISLASDAHLPVSTGIASVASVDVSGGQMVLDGNPIAGAVFSTLRLGEPNINLNGFSAPSVACTLHLRTAPTEGADNYALFAEAGESRFDAAVKIQADSQALELGAGNDATIQYDGTDLLIDPRAVGTGDLELTAGDFRLNDNQNVVFGTGEDATIDYNGTDMIINPRAVGVGDLEIQTADVRIARRLEHIGDPDTYMEFTGDNIDLVVGGATLMSLNEAGTDTITCTVDLFDVTTDIRGRSLFADGDHGTGIASTVALTNVTDTP